MQAMRPDATVPSLARQAMLLVAAGRIWRVYGVLHGVMSHGCSSAPATAASDGSAPNGLAETAAAPVARHKIVVRRDENHGCRSATHLDPWF
jgi:hypothetical protein